MINLTTGRCKPRLSFVGTCAGARRYTLSLECVRHPARGPIFTQRVVAHYLAPGHRKDLVHNAWVFFKPTQIWNLVLTPNRTTTEQILVLHFLIFPINIRLKMGKLQNSDTPSSLSYARFWDSNGGFFLGVGRCAPLPPIHRPPIGWKMSRLCTFVHILCVNVYLWPLHRLLLGSPRLTGAAARGGGWSQRQGEAPRLRGFETGAGWSSYILAIPVTILITRVCSSE